MRVVVFVGRTICTQSDLQGVTGAWGAFHSLLQSMLCFEHAVHSPTNMQLLLAKALDDGRSGQKAEDRHKWAAVAVSRGRESSASALYRCWLWCAADGGR